MQTLQLVVYTDAIDIGGAEISLGNLLAALGSDVVVTVLATDEAVGKAVAARRPGTALELVPPVRDKLDLPPIIAHLKAVRRLRPQIFHANLRTPYSCQYGIAAALATPGVAVVAVEHLPLATNSPSRRWLKRITSSRLAAHIAVGTAAARFVERDAGLRPGSIETIWNGVPDRSVRHQTHSPSVPPTIGSVGRLDHQKGFDVLVAALALLPPDVRCLLVGDGPERDSILAAARRYDVVDRLTLTGRLEDPAERVAEMDVFVLPSRYEGFPLVVLEAMLAGVPVVATDVGSVREAVEDGVTGVLVPADEPNALADAVHRLLADAELRARLADAAFARAHVEFTAEAMTGRYRDVYAAVVPPRDTRPRHLPALGALRRVRQPSAPFIAGEPVTGYYNDLRAKLGQRSPAEVTTELHSLVGDRIHANPVTVAQVALASWQRRTEHDAWTGAFRAGADWLATNLEEDGSLPYYFEVPDTYRVEPPWCSAMAQGQAASVFVRAALTLGDDQFLEAATKVLAPLLADGSPLVAPTPDGDVLEEYPTQPASHVLNGWIFALWGLYDVCQVCAEPAIQAAFENGLQCLVRRIDLYDVAGGWSRYDLYPHRIVHVAAPFYHHLHIAQLRATADLTGEAALRAKADEWDAASGRPWTYTTAVARKIAFRVLDAYGRRR